MIKNFAKGIIDDLFDGDENAFLKDIETSVRECLPWNKIIQDIEELPQYDESAHFIIKALVGYLPPKHFRISEEITLKKFIAAYQEKRMQEETFFDEISILAKVIRSKEMAEHSVPKYNESVFDDYHNFLPELAINARNRIIWVLGYEPHLKHSIKAEIIMRQAMASDTFHFSNDMPNEKDLHCANIVKFREIALTEGIVTAQNSSVISYHILKKFKKL